MKIPGACTIVKGTASIRAVSGVQKHGHETNQSNNYSLGFLVTKGFSQEDQYIREIKCPNIGLKMLLFLFLAACHLTLKTIFGDKTKHMLKIS